MVLVSHRLVEWFARYIHLKFKKNFDKIIPLMFCKIILITHHIWVFGRGGGWGGGFGGTNGQQIWKYWSV